MADSLKEIERLKLAELQRKRNAQQKLQEAIDVQHTLRTKEQLLSEAQKVSDRQRAIELENLPFSEKIKMRKDQEARQAKQRIISGHYEARVIVANEAKLKKNNDLLQKYIRQREQKMDTEAT